MLTLLIVHDPSLASFFPHCVCICYIIHTVSYVGITSQCKRSDGTDTDSVSVPNVERFADVK